LWSATPCRATTTAPLSMLPMARTMVPRRRSVVPRDTAWRDLECSPAWPVVNGAAPCRVASSWSPPLSPLPRPQFLCPHRWPRPRPSGPRSSAPPPAAPPTAHQWSPQRAAASAVPPAQWARIPVSVPRRWRSTANVSRVQSVGLKAWGSGVFLG